MSDWQTRITGEENPLTFTSPESGTVFTPFWRNTSVSSDRKIGEFSYPGFKGSQTQDLASRARRFPLVVWFSGPNYDIEANNFIDVLDNEVGNWIINNPVWGELTCQLVSFSADVDIVENGNIAVVSTQWIESQPQQSNVSPLQSSENVVSQIDIINESTSEQFGEAILDGEKVSSDPQLSRNASDLRSAIDAQIKRVNDLVSSRLGPLIKTASDLFNEFTSIQDALLNTLDEAEFLAAQAAGQIQQIVQLPSQVSESVQTKLTRYASFLDDLNGSVPTEATNTAINEASVLELTIGATISALCNTGINGTYNTRNEALEAAETIISAFNSSVEALETVQELYNNSSVTTQYKAQPSSYADLRQIVAYATQFLLDTSENLKIEKIIRVSTERTPITLAAKYYGSIDEQYIDLILNANKLKGKERIILNPGRELVVYV